MDFGENPEEFGGGDTYIRLTLGFTELGCVI